MRRPKSAQSLRKWRLLRSGLAERSVTSPFPQEVKGKAVGRRLGTEVVAAFVTGLGELAALTAERGVGCHGKAPMKVHGRSHTVAGPPFEK
ncbi:hypothetical protein MRX96_053314 [Rhipicephalus microplus]